jgi:hypothetical protein
MARSFLDGAFCLGEVSEFEAEASTSFKVALHFGLTIISRSRAHSGIGARSSQIRLSHSEGSRKFKSGLLQRGGRRNGECTVDRDGAPRSFDDTPQPGRNRRYALIFYGAEFGSPDMLSGLEHRDMPRKRGDAPSRSLRIRWIDLRHGVGTRRLADHAQSPRRFARGDDGEPWSVFFSFVENSMFGEEVRQNAHRHMDHSYRYGRINRLRYGCVLQSFVVANQE